MLQLYHVFLDAHVFHTHMEFVIEAFSVQVGMAVSETNHRLLDINFLFHSE